MSEEDKLVTITLEPQNHYSAGKFQPRQVRGDMTQMPDGSVKFTENPEGKWLVYLIPEETK